MRFAFLLLIFLVSASYAQIITGVVSDSKTNEPLPYVHIGVAGKNMGVISRDDGSYQIDVSTASRSDVLAFSIIGFETRTFNVGDLGPGRMDVRLSQKTYTLKEVVIRSKNEQPKTEKLGRFTPSKTTMGQSGLKEFGFGGEWGLRINHNNKKYFINNVQLHMRFNTVDSVLFRINMYAVDNDMPGESVLQKEIFMTSKKKQKWIARNLLKENLILDRDLIVTYEVVRVWFSKKGENRLFLTRGSGYEEVLTYYRASSQDAWAVDKNKQETLFPTLFLTVEEF
jgi:hypothetical protein